MTLVCRPCWPPDGRGGGEILHLQQAQGGVWTPQLCLVVPHPCLAWSQHRLPGLQYLLQPLPIPCSMSSQALTKGTVQVPIGSTIKLPRVLFCRNQEQIKIGQPYLEDVEIHAKILEDADGPTIRVEKFKPKKHYRRRNDHIQPLTRFLVTKVAPAS